MTINQLYKQVSQSIAWNAILYTLRKSLSTILTFFLFNKLSTRDFSIWANMYSAIFLTLLWLDFGLKKSLPRYLPEFVKNNCNTEKLVKKILFCKIVAIIFFTLFFIFVSKYIISTCSVIEKNNIFYIGCMLFVAEGFCSVIQIIYYSYLWQKQFNLLMSIVVVVKNFIICFFVFANVKSFLLLKSIFWTEISGTFVAGLYALFWLKSLFKRKKCTIRREDNRRKIKRRKNLNKELVLHSAALWFNDGLKSFSARNFMVLFFTRVLGPFQGNFFKLTNDCALLFQRIVIKTIGTTDTSLFSYIEISENNQKYITHAFEQLIRKISIIFIPLIGIMLPLLLHFNNMFQDSYVCILFFILIVFYIVETILYPYERLLEVKRKYKILFFSYTPYICMLCIICLFRMAIYKNIIFLIVCIYSMRISSYLVMLYFTKKKYNISFPIKQTVKIFLISLFLSILIYILLTHFL